MSSRLTRSLVSAIALLSLAAPWARAQTPAPATPPDCAALGRAPSIDLADTPENSTVLFRCGYDRYDAAEPAAAGRLFEAAIAMAVRRGDAVAQSNALRAYGDTLFTFGDGGRAEPMLLESLRIAETTGDPVVMAKATAMLGHLRTMQARYEESLAFGLTALEQWTASGDQRGIAGGLNNVGAAYRALGDYAAALDYLRRSLEMLDALGDRASTATVLDNMAVASMRLGDYGQGLALIDRSLAIRRERGDKAGIAKGLDTISLVHQARGNYAAALAAVSESLALRREFGLVHPIAESLNNIAVIYEAQGDYDQAARSLREALALNADKVGSASLRLEVQTHLGAVLLRQGRTTQAIQMLTDAVAAPGVSAFAFQLADARYTLGRALVAGGRPAAARTAFEEALVLRDTQHDREGRALLLIDLAELDRRQRLAPRGLARATEAVSLAETLDLPDVRWRALLELGRLQRTVGHRREAGQSFDAAIALIESVRALNPGREDTRSRFFEERLAPYRERLAMAVADGQVGEALSLAERARARALLDVLHGDDTAVTQSMTAEERTREATLKTALTSVNVQLTAAARAATPDRTRIAALQRARDARRLDFDAFQAQLYAQRPALQAGRAALPAISAGDASALLRGRRTAIVEYVFTGARTVALLVSTSGVRAFTLEVSDTSLAADVRGFRAQLAARDLRATASARALHDRVLGPLRSALAGVTELIVVPDGVLWELPFQALQASDGHYLIEDMAVSYAPSITVLREVMRTTPAVGPRTLVAFGDPSPGTSEALPDANLEVQRLARTYGPSSRIFVGPDATERRFTTDAPSARVIHIATHGLVDDASPLYSHLQFARAAADDGMLEAWELMNMPLRAELLVLSACETARGRVASGEGVLGLMWSAFVAGAQATLVSQWRVDSSTSATLMTGFHERWNASGAHVSKAQALRTSALAVMHSPGHAHPFYWAGFILVGDSR